MPSVQVIIKFGVVMRYIKYIIALIILSFSYTAMAESLVYYSISRGGSIYFYDKKTIIRNGNIVKLWIFIDQKNDKTERGSSERIYYKIDCENRTIGVISFYIYNSEDRVIDHGDDHGFVEMGSPPPISVVYTLINTICEL